MFTGPDLAALPREDAGMLNQEMRQQPLATDIVRFAGKAVVTQEPCRSEDAIELVSAVYTGARRNLVHVMRKEIFIDQATYASVASDAVELKVDLPLVTDQFPGHRIRGDLIGKSR